MTVDGRIELGKTGIMIPPLGLGTWQWGDRVFWDYGRTHTDKDLREVSRSRCRRG